VDVEAGLGDGAGERQANVALPDDRDQRLTGKDPAPDACRLFDGSLLGLGDAR
jgi:hypothetical protein